MEAVSVSAPRGLFRRHPHQYLGRDRLIFDTFRQSQTIHELDVRDGTVRALAAAVSSDRQPAYSRDGRRLLFTSNRSGNVDLFAYELDSGRLLQLTDHPANDWDGGYTPDGDSILWSSDRSGNLEIWMADADGSNPRQVTHDGANAENPTMTADGGWIVYSSGHADTPGIYKVRPDGSDTTRLLAGNWTNPEVSHLLDDVLHRSRRCSLPSPVKPTCQTHHTSTTAC